MRVPLQVWERPRNRALLRVESYVHSRQYRCRCLFLVDTGSELTILSSRTAQAMKFSYPGAPAETMEGAGGLVKLYALKGAILHFLTDNGEVARVPAETLYVAQPGKLRADILGNDFLRAGGWRLVADHGKGEHYMERP